MTAQEIEYDNNRAENAWKDALFLHDRRLYFKLYKDKPDVNEDAIEYRIPQTVGEVADALNMVRQAGGPELEFTQDEADDDWSWVERFKKSKAEEEPEAEAGQTDGFEALRTQDLED